MRKIKSFEEHNEGLKDFTRRLGSVVNKGLGKLKRIWIDDPGPETAFSDPDLLEKYDIETRKVDNYTYKFYHNERLVARIFQPEGDEGTEMGSPVFRILVYLYDSEIKNTKGQSMKVTDADKEIQEEIKKQREKPFYKVSKNAFTIQKLVQTFYEWWAAKTKSGRKTTAALNKPTQTATTNRQF